MALSLAGCSAPTRDFYDRDYQKPVTIGDLIDRSRHIVLGVVRNVRTVREGVLAVRDPGLLLDEVEVELAVENVLHGKLQPGRLRFEYFTYSTKNPDGYPGPPWIRAEPGERRIFFLTWESGIYRSVADVRGEYTIRVYSGRHRTLDTSRGAGFAIAEAVLRLGSGYEREGMTSPNWNIYGLCAISSEEHVFGLLKELAATRADPELAAHALFALQSHRRKPEVIACH